MPGTAPLAANAPAPAPIIALPLSIAAAMLCVLSLSLLRAMDQSSDALDCLGEPFCGDPLPVGDGVFGDRLPVGFPYASVGTRSCDVWCAKKHARRSHAAPSLHNCVRYLDGCSQHSKTPCAYSQTSPCGHEPLRNSGHAVPQ